MNKQTLILSLFTFLLFSSCSDDKRPNHQAKTEKTANYKLKIDSLLDEHAENNQFMGAVTLAQNGKTVYEKTVGFSDLEKDQKASARTKYRIGSITKSFTATLVFKAVEENKLELTQTIESYFPNVKNAENITIEYLLHHRSGIHSFTEDKWFFENRTKEISTTEMLAKISSYEIDFEPNSKGEYSNSNFYLLALILENTYETSYDQLLQEKICQPLNLKNTYVGKALDSDKNEAKSYLYEKKWEEVLATNLSTTKGTGSIVSTTQDLNTFFESLLTEKIITEENLNLMKTIKDAHGMGIFRYKIVDRQGFGHGGRIDEFRTNAICFPEENLTFSLLSNGSQDDINELYTEILKLYFDDAPVEIAANELEKFAKTYTSEDDDNDQAVFIQKGNDLVHVINNEFEEVLVYKGNNRFVMEQMHGESISFIFSVDGEALIFEQGDYKGNYYVR